MKILLVGSGGREHALAWRLAQSPSCDSLFAAPGNPGIAEHATLLPIAVDAIDTLVQAAVDHAVNFVVVGPEVPLVLGLADRLRAEGIAVFGPGAPAAQLEGSKGFVKDLCAAHAIPTAAYRRCTSADEALAVLPDFGLPVVIKADGLAAGKGVIIAETTAEAEAAIADMFSGSFGSAGASVVIEEFMTGEEASLFALCDGETVRLFGTAQDHKRVGDGDIGPNTGGMGAYSPAPVMTADLIARAMAEIVEPTARALTAAGTPYVGVLFAGLMLTDAGPKLIEYNCRFGDPECQVLMMRYTGDLAALLHAVAVGRLADAPAPTFSEDYALTVVMAARGYPGTPAKGGAIHDLATAETDGAKIFHAGTALADGQLVATGGRVLNVTASGPSVRAAQTRAYSALDTIDYADGFARRDIGWREVEREAKL
ncbi:MAG: phosphoribosylamine--glycine ligase [Sphingopyxis sp.]|nr:phosphoribosylamine--glycine ligase [Sphingopyxis sp.]